VAVELNGLDQARLAEFSEFISGSVMPSLKATKMSPGFSSTVASS